MTEEVLPQRGVPEEVTAKRCAPSLEEIAEAVRMLAVRVFERDKVEAWCAGPVCWVG